jgi:hypothetical protein
VIDENAFGLYVGWATLDDEEYALEPAEFAARHAAFHAAVEEYLAASPLGTEPFAIDFGHALYLELADGDQDVDFIAWLRGLRALLHGRDLESVCVLSHGGRWVLPAGVEPRSSLVGGLPVFRLPGPSEPLRRALAAAVAAVRESEDDGESAVGWGPGLYLDADAIEALGRKLANGPTPLVSGGATFFRVGR